MDLQPGTAARLAGGRRKGEEEGPGQDFAHHDTRRRVGKKGGAGEGKRSGIRGLRE